MNPTTLNPGKAGLMALAVLSLLAASLPQARGELRQDNQPRQPLLDYARQFVAANGGPAVTTVIESPDFSPTVNNGIIVNGKLVVSGTLGPRDLVGRITLWGGAHTVFYAGTTPDRITRIRVYTGTNWLNDPGQVLDVDLTTLRAAPGVTTNNYTSFNHVDLFGAKLIGDIPGLASISFAPANTGDTVVHAGCGFSLTISEKLNGTYSPRDFSYDAWNARVIAGTSPGVSDQYFNNSAFGYSIPPQGKNALSNQGDSSGPVMSYNSILRDGNGRITSVSLAGIGVGHSGGVEGVGANIYLDTQEPSAAQFIASFMMPEPAALVINASTNFGFANGQFRFTLTGPAGSNAVISASTNLQTWTPLLTNTLTGGSLNFTDNVATNYPRRFYRANLQ